MNKNKCKDCKFFKRAKWHKTFGGGDQAGGSCEVLMEVLRIDNSYFFLESMHNDLYIQDTFGCVLWEKEEIKE